MNNDVDFRYPFIDLIVLDDAETGSISDHPIRKRVFRMNEIDDDRYCSRKVNRMKMFLKVLFNEKKQ